MIKTEKLYSLDDISVIPEVSSDIKSRSECNPFTESIEGKSGFLPVIAAPMDSVVDEENYKSFWESGISCVIPRTTPLEKRLKLCEKVFCAFGFKEIEEEFLEKNYEGRNLYILIDVANGHMTYQFELGKSLKNKYGDHLKLMGGNIANPETYKCYDNYGFDYVRCGVGGGRGCITSVQSSIHFPMASLIDKISEVKKEIQGKTKIIADGGIKNYSDVIKCLALGADYLMMGYALSKSLEAAGDLYTEYGTQIISREKAKEYLELGKDVFKEYHGMSTKIVQAKILGIDLEENRKNLKTSEGRIEKVKVEYTLPGWSENLNSYLRSAMSYTGNRTLRAFRTNTICQVISDSTREKLNNR